MKKIKVGIVGMGYIGESHIEAVRRIGFCELYAVADTNAALARSKASNRIQIGVKLTKGLGAGADPTVGKAAAEENKEAIQEALKNTDLLFITAGMGGGTGTGAAPVIAKIAKEMKILTVAVVTLPFSFEAKRRMDNAVAGIEELRKSVDSIITIPNDKIRQVVPKGTSFSDSLKVADEVLRQGIRGIAELIVKPSLINLDFADVKTTLKDRGLAHMGIGSASGKDKAENAAKMAISSPLLETSIKGATGVIISISASPDVGLEDVDMASSMITGECNPDADVIWGVAFDPELEDEMRVTIISTGFSKETNEAAEKAAALAEAIANGEEIPEESEEEPKKTGDFLDDFFSGF